MPIPEEPYSESTDEGDGADRAVAGPSGSKGVTRPRVGHGGSGMGETGSSSEEGNSNNNINKGKQVTKRLKTGSGPSQAY